MYIFQLCALNRPTNRAANIAQKPTASATAAQCTILHAKDLFIEESTEAFLLSRCEGFLVPIHYCLVGLDVVVGSINQIVIAL